MALPTVIDAISAIRGGDVEIPEIKIGDLIVSALLRLSAPSRKEVTRRPMQSGFDIGIAVKDMPLELDMEIFLSDPEYSPEDLLSAVVTGTVEPLYRRYWDDMDVLYTYFDDREILNVQTHDILYTGLVIESIDPKYDADQNFSNGLIMSVRLVQFSQTDVTAAAVSVDNAITSSYISMGRL